MINQIFNPRQNNLVVIEFSFKFASLCIRFNKLLFYWM